MLPIPCSQCLLEAAELFTHPERVVIDIPPASSMRAIAQELSAESVIPDRLFDVVTRLSAWFFNQKFETDLYFNNFHSLHQITSNKLKPLVFESVSELFPNTDPEKLIQELLENPIVRIEPVTYVKRCLCTRHGSLSRLRRLRENNPIAWRKRRRSLNASQRQYLQTHRRVVRDSELTQLSYAEWAEFGSSSEFQAFLKTPSPIQAKIKAGHLREDLRAGLSSVSRLSIRTHPVLIAPEWIQIYWDGYISAMRLLQFLADLNLPYLQDTSFYHGQPEALQHFVPLEPPGL